jgi:hypothetical protein
MRRSLLIWGRTRPVKFLQLIVNLPEKAVPMQGLQGHNAIIGIYGIAHQNATRRVLSDLDALAVANAMTGLAPLALTSF